MGKFIIQGGRQLKGSVRIAGSKNSVLPILAATLLAEGESIIEDVPCLKDVRIMCGILKELGAAVEEDYSRGTISVRVTGKISTNTPYELVNKMRASFLVSGPILSRWGEVRIAMPGGCAIGSRPVDLHMKGFSAMGAAVMQGHGYMHARAVGRLRGSRIYLDFPSVGATENIMMAATLADGQTVIENAASEPEIVDLATFLVSMGADIKGAGTDTVRINGVQSLQGARHSVIPDRIEAGTFMAAAAITGGEITLTNVVPDHLKPVCAKLREAGIEISEELSCITVCAQKPPKPLDIKTHPYPGFPTDMQAQMTSLMSIAGGTSMIVETIFENRFMHVGELKRMGADIRIEGRSAIIEGKACLTGAEVCATDLRAGAALVLAGLAAHGTTMIDEIEHIDRGYVNMEEKLNALGAAIKRVE